MKKVLIIGFLFIFSSSTFAMKQKCLVLSALNRGGSQLHVARKCEKICTPDCMLLEKYLTAAKKHRNAANCVHDIEERIAICSKEHTVCLSVEMAIFAKEKPLPEEVINVLKARLKQAQQEYPNYQKAYIDLLSEDEKTELNKTINTLVEDIADIGELTRELTYIYQALE